MNNEPELLKIEARGDKIKTLKYSAEKHAHEIFFANHLILMMNIIRRNINPYIKRKSYSLSQKFC